MKERLASLDILRGADMFLLLALGPVVRSICKLYPDGTAWLAHQFRHVSWEGFVLWDLIMPLFLFMSGITIPFSMAAYRDGRARPDRKFYLKLLKRFCLLFLLGWIVQGNLLEFSWKDFHPYANTLQAIAVGYVVAALLFVYFRPRWQIVAGVALFAAYWIAFACTGMNLDPQDNIAMAVDKALAQREAIASLRPLAVVLDIDDTIVSHGPLEMYYVEHPEAKANYKAWENWIGQLSKKNLLRS